MLKKSISLLFVICLLFSLSACGTIETSSNPTDIPFESQTDIVKDDEENTVGEENGQLSSNTEETNKNGITQTQTQTNQSKPTSNTNQPLHTHSYSNATCTSPKKCSCGNTKGVALGHEYKNGVCSICGVVDKEEILAKIDENSSNLSFYKSMLDNEESILKTFETTLKMYQNELDEAKTKLEKVKSQKTIRVYREGFGWVYEADPYQVKLAQDDVDHYTYMVESQQSLVNSCNKNISKYKKLIEETEREIEELKKKL